MDVYSIVDKCLRLGADDVVVSRDIETTKQVRFANSEITATKTWDSESVEIFLVKNKKVVATEINDFTKLDKAIEDLIKLANSMKENKDYLGIAEGSFRYRERSIDKKILDADLVDLVKAGINACEGRTAGALYSTYKRNEIATSSGISGKDEDCYVEISLRTFSQKEASGHAVSCATNLSDFNPEKAGEKASEIANLAKNPKPYMEGRYNILFTPLCFANLMSSIMFQTSAFYVDAGISMFKDKISEKVASDVVTIYDDATYEKGLFASKYDDEGVPRKRNCVIKNGVLKTYLHNTSTAKRYKTETTANAGLIAPSPTNVFLEPGDFSMEEIFEELKNGLYVTNTWYTRFQNYMTGDFSTIPRDGIFVVEKGEIKESVKDLRISDNMMQILKNIKALGKDIEQIHWWECQTPIFLPHVLVKDVGVTRSTQ